MVATVEVTRLEIVDLLGRQKTRGLGVASEPSENLFFGDPLDECEYGVEAVLLIDPVEPVVLIVHGACIPGVPDGRGIGVRNYVSGAAQHLSVGWGDSRL